jgi:hypothetical protein
VTDPCNYAGAFWNGATYLAGWKEASTLQCVTPIIAVVVLAAGFYLYCKFSNKKQPR